MTFTAAVHLCLAHKHLYRAMTWYTQHMPCAVHSYQLHLSVVLLGLALCDCSASSFVWGKVSVLQAAVHVHIWCTSDLQIVCVWMSGALAAYTLCMQVCLTSGLHIVCMPVWCTSGLHIVFMPVALVAYALFVCLSGALVAYALCVCLSGALVAYALCVYLSGALAAYTLCEEHKLCQCHCGKL